MSWSLRLNIVVAIIAELFRVWRATRSSSKTMSEMALSGDLPVSRDFHHKQQQFKT